MKKVKKQEKKNENFDFVFVNVRNWWKSDIVQQDPFVRLCSPLLSRQLVATNQVFCLSVNRFSLFAVLIPCTFV